MTRLAEGSEAPAFTLPDQRGKRVSLGDFNGRKVLLFFYPEADTPGCTAQACAARDGRPRLTRKKVAVLGISPDLPDAQRAFDRKFRLGFPLLSDPSHAVATAYGVWGEKIFFGRTIVGIVRSAFLVDEKGRIERAWYRVGPEKMMPAAFEALA